MTDQCNELTLQSPFVARMRAYLKQRFPLIGHGILIVSYYSSNQFLAEVLTRPDEKLVYNVGSLLGAITLFCGWARPPVAAILHPMVGVISLCCRVPR